MPFAPTRATSTALFAAAISLVAQGICAGQSTPLPPASHDRTQMNCGARIECVTPDGTTGHVSRLSASNPGATALIMDDDSVTCLLQEGLTDFVVELPRARQIDRLTFLNENALARGELKIAVSNERLAAASNAWVEVEGIVPFSHKRLFGVSLVGIEAKFLRLSFRVDKPGRVAAYPVLGRATLASAPDRDSFKSSALADALDSKFATQHERGKTLLLAIDASVGPLSPAAR